MTVNNQLTEANQSRSGLHFAAKTLQFYRRNVCGKGPLMVFGPAFHSKPGCHQHVARVVVAWSGGVSRTAGEDAQSSQMSDRNPVRSGTRDFFLRPPRGNLEMGSLGNLKIQCPLVKPRSNHAGQAGAEMLPSVQGSLRGHTRAVPPASHRYHRQLSSVQTNTCW